jgi:hypothetical protein
MGAEALANRAQIPDNPVFLVGSMRSGTTLLAELLGRSKGLAHCGFELKDIWSHAGIPMASPKTRDTVCPECRAFDARPGMVDALSQAFLARMDMCEGKLPGAALLNKNPHLCNKLALVLALFPTARVIWIHREMPKVVASVKRLFIDVWQRQRTWHYWPLLSPHTRNRCWEARFGDAPPTDCDPSRTFPGGDVSHIAEYWLESNRAVAEFSAGAPGTVCEIAEERLLAAPVTELERLFAFLGVPAALDDDLIKGMDPSRDVRWRRDLSSAEVQALAGFAFARGSEIGQVFRSDDTVFGLREALAGQSFAEDAR